MNVYSAPIVQLLGASSPLLFSFVAVYAGLKRMQWLRGGDRLLKGSTLVKKLTLNGDLLLVEDFNKKTHNLRLSSSNIYRIDNDIRREIYYIINGMTLKINQIVLNMWKVGTNVTLSLEIKNLTITKSLSVKILPQLNHSGRS